MKKTILLNDLVKRVIDTALYNSMMIDQSEVVKSMNQVTNTLMTKDLPQIAKEVINPLIDQFEDSEDREEKKYIAGTVQMIYEYIFQ